MEQRVPDPGRITFVLDRPSHPGNIGAAARALKVMGFRQLAVVQPRTPGFAAHPEARAFASGATDVLAATRAFPTLDEALADATLVIAASASGREMAPPASTPEQVAWLVREELARDPRHRVALLFGTERTGLSIEDARRAQCLCSIPTDPGYGSLNLSQAVMVLAYCLRRGGPSLHGRGDGGDGSKGGKGGKGGEEGAHAGDNACGAAEDDAGTAAGALRVGSDGVSHRGFATQDQIEGLFRHLEAMTVAVGFLDPRAPKRLMPRLRRLFSRTRLEVEEVDILRGICRAAIAAARSDGDER